jgi:hypothetical protein
MDARNDRVYNAGRAGTHCRDSGPGPALHGLGFYTYQFPQSAPPARGPTPGRPWTASPRRRWSSRAPVTTCRGPRAWPTVTPCPGPSWSTCATPATTPTRTSRPPTWRSCGPSWPAGPSRPRPGPGTAPRSTTKGRPSAGPGRLRWGHRRLVALTAMAATISTAMTKMVRTAGSTRPPSDLGTRAGLSLLYRPRSAAGLVRRPSGRAGQAAERPGWSGGRAAGPEGA